MSLQQMLLGTGAAAAFTCDAADFDGTNDYMTRGAALTGIVDDPQGILSCWVRFDGGDATGQQIMSSGGYWQVRKNAANKIFFECVGNGGLQLFDATCDTTTLTADATWHHIGLSWDMNFSAGNKLFSAYIDGTLQSTTKTDADIAFSVDYDSATDFGVGARVDGLVKLNGCLAEYYFNSVAYLDLSTNLTKFRSAGGKPVDLGATGATPTGTAPIVYQRIADGAAATTFATNLGGGGNLTITGTLDIASTSPSD